MLVLANVAGFAALFSLWIRALLRRQNAVTSVKLALHELSVL